MFSPLKSFSKFFARPKKGEISNNFLWCSSTDSTQGLWFGKNIPLTSLEILNHLPNHSFLQQFSATHRVICQKHMVSQKKKVHFVTPGTGTRPVSFVRTICTSSSSTVLPSAAFKRYCVWRFASSGTLFLSCWWYGTDFLRGFVYTIQPMFYSPQWFVSLWENMFELLLLQVKYIKLQGKYLKLH